ncbi:MAG: hypothetical protein KDG55_06600 [Rhodocyclaceae bacterium]|nr:hypothetical protein [Rhodocyclaceae bacterium]
MVARLAAGRLGAALLTVALLLGPATGRAGDEISVAETSVFMREHLSNVGADASLHYAFQRQETAQPDVADTVTVFIKTEADRGRVVNAEFLHGERALSLPEVEHASSNPVVLFFLEHDVRDMHQRLGGKENYFRKRIRLALANEATVEPVRFAYRGKEVAGTRVSVQPYRDDPNKHRFQGMEGKRYYFMLSDEVPGGFFEIGSVVEGDDARKVPGIREVLTLSPDNG